MVRVALGIDHLCLIFLWAEEMSRLSCVVDGLVFAEVDCSVLISGSRLLEMLLVVLVIPWWMSERDW